MYVDKNDRSIRWEAHVRRKFGDGVWLYVVGPPAHTWPSDSDHHAACCTSASDHWAATQHNDASYIVSPIARHLRCVRYSALRSPSSRWLALYRAGGAA